MFKKFLLFAAFLLFLGAALPGRFSDLFSEKTPKPESPPDEAAAAFPPCSLSLLRGGFEKTAYIGQGLSEVLAVFGEAAETLESEYGFLWYVYAGDYKEYMQIGISEKGAVAGLYSAAAEARAENCAIGEAMSEVRSRFGTPLAEIRKGDVLVPQLCEIDGKRERDIFLRESADGKPGAYLTFFYDCFNNQRVTGINIIDRAVEEGFLKDYGALGEERLQTLAHCFEKENFHAVNALRAREGLSTLVWSEELRRVALGHSRDMARRDYFAHESPEGKTLSDRFKEKSRAEMRSLAENLAMGMQNGREAHEFLMNSEGHRRNILSDVRLLGAGAAFREDTMYLTQNYALP
jgi:uncharacterized protein YkwD